MDSQLNNPVHARSAIGKNLRTSYKISSVREAVKTLASLLATLTNLAGWRPNQSPRQANQPKIVTFLELVIQKLVGRQGHDWQSKFKGKKHIGVAILVKVQRILSKLALAAGDSDVEFWNFEEGPMPHDMDTELREAYDLMEFFLFDLHRAVTGQELGAFGEVPPLYTTLFPPAPAPTGRGSEKSRNKPEDATGNQNGGGGRGGAGGGAGGADKGGHNPRSANGDAHNANRNSPDKDKGIFIIDQHMPRFISQFYTNGVPHPPKVTVDGKEVTICIKGSSRGKVCTKENCRFAHIFNIDKITKGLSELNTYLKDTNGVTWCTPAVATAAAKAKATVLKEETGKKE